MIQPSSPVVLPANIFDALEFSALVNGGVGTSCTQQQEFVDGKSRETISKPVCIIGHGFFLDGTPSGIPAGYEPGPVVTALAKAFGFKRDHYGNVFEKNDTPVADYLAERYDSTTKEVIRGSEPLDVCSMDVERKVTWKKWCKLVGVVRGA